MDFILNNLKTGHFVLTLHAQERMDMRGISFQDIVHVGHTAKTVKEIENGKYEIDGFDLDARRLIVICAYHHKTLIVTVFHKSRKRK